MERQVQTMTKEQEQAIINAFNDAFCKIAPVDKLISGAVLAAIKVYDEQVNGGAKEPEKDSKAEAEADSVVVFRPCAGSGFLVFNSLKEMGATLSKKCEAAISFSDEIITIGDMKNAREVYTMIKDEEYDYWFVGDCIGYCDYETFKRG